MSEIKPVLRQMIDNNKPHWRPETIRGAHKMLDEYEAKAKAFDGIKELINAHDCAIEEEMGLGHLFILDLKGITKYAESGEKDV